MIQRTYYVLVLQSLHSKFLQFLSLPFNPACANYILHRTRQDTYFRTWTYLYVLVPKGLTQISKTKLTYVSRYRPYISNDFWNINKMSNNHTSHNQIKKTTFASLFLIRISPLFLPGNNYQGWAFTAPASLKVLDVAVGNTWTGAS